MRSIEAIRQLCDITGVDIGMDDVQLQWWLDQARARARDAFADVGMPLSNPNARKVLNLTFKTLLQTLNDEMTAQLQRDGTNVRLRSAVAAYAWLLPWAEAVRDGPFDLDHLEREL